MNIRTERVNATTWVVRARWSWFDFGRRSTERLLDAFSVFAARTVPSNAAHHFSSMTFAAGAPLLTDIEATYSIGGR